MRPRLLESPSDATAWTRWLVDLYWPLRSRSEWGKPISFEAIEGYLRMRGHDPAELFDWILVCDEAVLGWMNEHAERQRKQEKPIGGRPTRH